MGNSDSKPVHSVFTINGFYMAMREKYTKADAKIHYYVVEWDGDKLSWADFRGQVLGATDPTEAAEGSVRREIYDKWEELGLTSCPNVGDNGVHASASPFEALCERMNWLSEDLAKDSFGSQLLAAGIDKETIMAWTKDPQVPLDGKNVSCFDCLEDTTTTECLTIMKKIAEKTEAKEEEKASNTCSAFVFIKPHAAGSEKVAEAVNAAFVAKGMKILTEGDIDGPTIEKNQFIDNHYYAIANKASLSQPKDLSPTDKAQEAFKEKFGLDWKEVVKSKEVLNAVDACKKLGVTGEEMDTLWAAAKKSGNLVKFGGGFYAGKVARPQEIFAINGFYMAMREKYTKADAKIHYYVVSWDSRKLSWADFRGKVLGATDPTEAAEGSVRREIYNKWEELGLTSCPNVGDNGVHASASPFEALCERMNWLGASLETDYFGAEMLKTIPKETIMNWTKDPQVVLDDKKVSCFDSLEDINSSECLAVAQKMAGLEETKSATHVNTAFVFIKPHAADSTKVAELVSAALEKEGLLIMTEGDIDGPTIEKKQFIDNHYYAIANKASLSKPKDLNPTPEAQEAFKEKFGVTWADTVTQGYVFNAVDACAKLNVDGEKMDTLWAAAKKDKKLVKFGGGFYAGKVTM